jgi:hypothetical protein
VNIHTWLYGKCKHARKGETICAQIYDSTCVIKQELEWVWRWNRGREYGQMREAGHATEYDWKDGNSSTLLLLLAGTPERHRRLPENRTTCASPWPAGLQQRSRLSPSACLNNRTISEHPAAHTHPRDRNKLDPTWGVRDIMSCSTLKLNRRFGGIYLAHSSILKMELCSSETSVNFQRTIWRYITEDRARHNHRCEKLKS